MMKDSVLFEAWMDAEWSDNLFLVNDNLW